MKEEVIYLKCNRNVICNSKDVFFTDIGSLFCENKAVAAKLRSVKIHHFNDENYVVISILKVIEMLQRECSNIQIENLGEQEIILEPAFSVENKSQNKFKEKLKIAFVSGICFFGTGFTIMAFQNDVGINKVFARVYEILIGEEAKEITILQISYSVGLFLGILLFFNHMGKRKLTSDPTPIQVSMKNYEDDVNKTLVQGAEREGREIDV